MKIREDILNKGLLYDLIKIGETKDKRPQLVNLTDMSLIRRLFEFIFIILKLKYINKQSEDIKLNTINQEK